MDDQRAQSRPERRARLQPLRCGCCDVLVAAGANAAMAVDAGDGRTDGRQLDVIVGMDAGLVGGAERIGAMRTGGQRRLDDAIGMFGERAADTGATITALLQPIGEVRLLALRGWRARVVRGLGRGAEPRLQLRNPRRQQSDLRSLHLDQADQIILGVTSVSRSIPILDYFTRTNDGRAALKRSPQLSAWWSRIEQRSTVHRHLKRC